MNCDPDVPLNEAGKHYLFEQIQLSLDQQVNDQTQNKVIERLEALASTKDVSISNIMSSYEEACKAAPGRSINEEPQKASTAIESLKELFEEQASKQESLHKRCDEQISEIETLQKEKSKLNKKLRQQGKVSDELSAMIDKQAAENEKLLSMVEQQRDRIRMLEDANNGLKEKLNISENETKKKQASFKEQKKGISSLKQENRTLEKKANQDGTHETSNNLQIKIDPVELENKNLKEKITKAQEQYKNVEKGLEEEQSRVKIFEKLCKEQSDLIGLLIKKNDHLVEKIQLEGDAVDLKKKRDSIVLSSQERTLQEKLEAAEKDIKRLKHSAKKYKSKLEKSQKLVDQLTKENTSPSEGTKESLSKELCALKKENQLLEEELEDIKTDAESIFLMLETHNLSDTKLQVKVVEMEKIRERIISSFEELDQKAQIQESQVERYQNTLQTQGEQFAHLENKIENLETTVKSQNETIKKLKSEKGTLQRELNKAEQSLEVSLEGKNSKVLYKKLNLTKTQDRIPASLRSLAPEGKREKVKSKPTKTDRSGLLTVDTEQAGEKAKEMPSPVRSICSIATGTLQISPSKKKAPEEKKIEKAEPQFEQEFLPSYPLLHAIDVTTVGRDAETVMTESQVTTNPAILKNPDVDMKEDDKVGRHVSFKLTTSSSEDGSNSTSSTGTGKSIDGDHRLPAESHWLKDCVQ